MQPSQIRERVLRDHRSLRCRLVELESLALAVSAGEQHPVGALRRAAGALLRVLREHMHWEDRYLAPALADADAWGPERAAILAEDHRQQRAFLGGIVDELNNQDRAPGLLAASLLELVRHLLEDMEGEEAFFLDPDVLRDDVIGIDVETG